MKTEKYIKKVILEYLESGKIEKTDYKLNELANANGLYVSIYKNNERRGCLGFTGNFKAKTGIVEMLSILSATRDDRYQSIKKEEVQDLEINLWKIENLTEVESIYRIDFSKYGVWIKDKTDQSTVLPYFTRAHQNNQDEIFAELSSKSNFTKEKLSQYQVYRLQASIVS